MSKKETVFEQAMSTLLAKVDSTEKFVVEQSPEVCRQLIAEKVMLEKMDVITSSLIFVFLAPVTGFALFRIFTGEFSAYSNAPAGYCFLAALTGTVVVVSLLSVVDSIQNLMRLKIAPKVFLLREFSEFAKRN